MDNSLDSNRFVNQGLSLGQFLRLFVFDYRRFVNEYLTDRPPYLYAVIYILGMASAIDRVEMPYLRGGEYSIDSWLYAWAIILIGGIFSGIIGYFLGGLFYHIRVKISGGNREYRHSCYLFLYSGLPLYVIAIVWEILDTFIYGNAYFTEPTYYFLDISGMLVTYIAIAYTLYLSYVGVRILHQTKPIRSVIFFIIVPALFYLLFFGGLIIHALSQYDACLDYNETAIMAMNDGDYEDAERLFLLAVESLTKDDQEDLLTIRSNLGLLYELMGDTTRALEQYDICLTCVPPGGAEYFIIEGEKNLIRGLIYEAVVNYDKALQVEPENAVAHMNLGLIYMGEYGYAYADYFQALIHNERYFSNDKCVHSITNLANNYIELGYFN